jgi:hypothetical protein
MGPGLGGVIESIVSVDRLGVVGERGGRGSVEGEYSTSSAKCTRRDGEADILRIGRGEVGEYDIGRCVARMLKW